MTIPFKWKLGIKVCVHIFILHNKSSGVPLSIADPNINQTKSLGVEIMVVCLCRVKQKADFFSHVIPSRYLPGIKVKKWRCFKKMKHLQKQKLSFLKCPPFAEEKFHAVGALQLHYKNPPSALRMRTGWQPRGWLMHFGHESPILRKEIDFHIWNNSRQTQTLLRKWPMHMT